MFQIREQKGGGRRERERERAAAAGSTQRLRYTAKLSTYNLLFIRRQEGKRVFSPFLHFFTFAFALSLSPSLPLSLVLLIICSIRHPTIVIHLPPQKCYCANCRQCDFIRLFTFYIEEEEKKIQNIYLNLKEKDYKDKIPTNRGLLILLFLFLLLFLPFVYAHCDIFIYHFETPLDPKKGNNI